MSWTAVPDSFLRRRQKMLTAPRPSSHRRKLGRVDMICSWQICVDCYSSHYHPVSTYKQLFGQFPGKSGANEAGRCAVPQPLLYLKISTVSVPSRYLPRFLWIHRREQLTDLGVVLVASSKHLSMKQQVTDRKTFIWSKKHFATSSFAAGGQALPAASPTRLLGSLTQSAHLVRLNTKKEGCSSVFLISWLIASQLLSYRLTPSLQSLLTARQHLSASLIFLFSPLVTSQCVPQHFDIPVHVDTVLWLSRLTWPSFCSLSCLRSMRTGQHGHVL